MESKIRALEKIYDVYEAFTADLDLSCVKGCSFCCTCNVTLTGLEAVYLLETLEKDVQMGLFEKLDRHFPEKRFVPQTTTNRFAELCINGQEAPQEENDPYWGTCPLLAEELCPVYRARPFGCRSLISESPCRETGYARIPPLALTVNNALLQYIEHIDQGGVFGNLSDVLSVFSTERVCKEYKKTEPSFDSIRSQFPRIKERVLKNRKIPALLVPPEHRTRIAPLLKEISNID
ncbi:MAG: hypothetical protein K9J83_01840 [Desulfarculaceae bacterium]|nr:hypothetical protein [Desulfarculaceae bacterium]